MQLSGIHHLTAITADAPGNHRFYTQVLGMRLVKRTVNQDDVSAYHLFYADNRGSPGTDLTFFDWPAGPERRGHASVSRTGLRVNGSAALEWWSARLAAHGVRAEAPVERDNRLTLDFEDPEGQRLMLVDDGGAGEAHPWADGPVPAEHQIRGLGPLVLSLARIEPTEAALTGVLNMRHERDYAGPGGVPTRVYAMGPGGAAAELHLAAEPNLPAARQGAGAVHHLALRVPDDQYENWARRLRELRLPSSGPVDRYYFRSLYFREPGGVLFEIATDGPGFDVDEPRETLGRRLALPPFLEPRRAEIEAGLRPLD